MMSLANALAILHTFVATEMSSAERRVVRQARRVIHAEASASMKQCRDNNRLSDLGGEPLRPDTPKAPEVPAGPVPSFEAALAFQVNPAVTPPPAPPVTPGEMPYTTRMTPKEIEIAFDREPKHTNTPFSD
jgi:hypothetical protein